MRSSVKKLYDLLPEGDVYKIGLLFLMMIFSSFLALLGVGMVPVFVSAVIDAERVLNHPLAGDFLKWIDVTTASELTIFGSFLLFAIYLFKNLYMLFYDYVHQKFMLNRQHFLQNRMFRAYMNSPYTFFIDRNSSELLRNINDEITKILRGTLRPIFFVTLNSLMALVIVAGLVVVEPLITGLGILFFGGFSYIFLRMTRDRLSYYGSESLRHRKSMTKAVLEGLHGFKDARVLSRENYFLNSFRGHSFKHKNYDIYQNILNVMPRRIIEMIALSGILFIAIVMVAQGRETTAIVPMIALYGAAVMKVRPSMNLVIENINQIRYNVHSVDAVYKDLKLLESYENRSEADEDVEKLALHSEIELRDVWFSYPNSNEPAVKNINLTIPKNSAVAFVGPSGAGKTTLVDVILGLLEPQEGAIQIDGADLFSNRNRWQKYRLYPAVYLPA
jgi:ATP-binding cassette subfamily C protein